MTAEEWEKKVRGKRTSKDVILAIGIEDIMPPEDIRLLEKYYKKEKYFKTPLKGDSCTYNSNLTIDMTPTEEDFMKTIADYMSWRISENLHGHKV